jgi:hypothetical protein
MTDRFEPLHSGEVVSVQHDTQVLTGHRTFKVGELSDSIRSHLEAAISGWSEEKSGWFDQQGIECEALRFGSNGWKKGRIRLCLEFCPDESEANLLSASKTIDLPSSNPVPDRLGQAIPPMAHIDVPTIPVTFEQSPDVSVETMPINGSTNSTVVPVASVAAIAVGTVVAKAIATDNASSANIEGSSLSPLADTVLELEEHHSEPIVNHGEGFDEIAFDFDSANGDLGTMIPNGMMELDLTDLGLDSDQDFLNFEGNGTIDPAQELIGLQDLDAMASTYDHRPENSGMLIDEVWNEMSQPNWPSIN